MAAKPIRRRLMNLEDNGMAAKFGQNHLIMKANSIAIACCLGIVLSGCTYSTTSHSFKFYGATQESFGRDFFYVQYGVIGSATATYNPRGGGHVREGLIADAKNNLIKAYPLGPSQSYVNLSIDISNTEVGQTLPVNKVSSITLTATVSADVIQFGQPPVGYSVPLNSARSLGKVNLESDESLDSSLRKENGNPSGVSLTIQPNELLGAQGKYQLSRNNFADFRVIAVEEEASTLDECIIRIEYTTGDGEAFQKKVRADNEDLNFQSAGQN